MGVSVLLASMVLFGSPSTPQSSFVPGEVLIKFVPDSDGSQAVVKASQSVPLQLEELTVVTDRLGEETDVPVKATQVSSGDWVLLKIDTDKLNDRILERLRKREYIQDAQISQEEQKKYIGFTPPKRIVVEFSSGSSESQSFAQEVEQGAKVPSADLLTKLATDCSTPLKGEVNPKEGLLVEADLKAITPTLADRLKALPEVEAVQLNYVMKSF